MADPDVFADDSGLPSDVGGTVVTVGTFDGVHRGHRHVLRRVSERAADLGLRSLLVTFAPHPLEVVKPSRAPLLLTPGEERLEALAATAIDYVAVVPFTARLAALEADEFVDRVLRSRFRMRHLVMGYDHGFGRGRTGDAERLRVLGAERGFGVEVVPPVALDGDGPIGSSAIRRAVGEGRLDVASAALGRPYAASGRVTHGERRGRLLGFPTLNIALPHPRKLLPPVGVYAVRVQTPAGSFGGMMNLGPRPTFGDAAIGLEAHLFDASAELYGAVVRVDFVGRLRDTRRFDSPEALVAQLHDDAAAARAVLRDVSMGQRPSPPAVSVDSPGVDR